MVRDIYGRPKINTDTSGMTINFGNSGDAFIFANGKPYFLNADDGLYYELICSTLNGIRTFAPADVGISI